MSSLDHHQVEVDACRIRLVFGTTRKQWALVLNYNDDGDGNDGTGKRQQQEIHWSNLPFDLTQNLQHCATKGWDIAQLDLGGRQENAWYMAGTKGATGTTSAGFLRFSDCFTRHSSLKSIIETSNPILEPLAFGERNGSFSMCHIHRQQQLLHPNDDDSSYFYNLSKELVQEIQRRHNVIQLIRLFPNGAYFLRDNQGRHHFGGVTIPIDCRNELQQCHQEPVIDMAISRDNEWVVLRLTTFATSRGVDQVLLGHLREFYLGRKERQHQQRVVKLREQQQLVETMKTVLDTKSRILQDQELDLQAKAKAVIDAQERAKNNTFQSNERATKERLQAREDALDKRAEHLESREDALIERVERAASREYALDERIKQVDAREAALNDREEQLESREDAVDERAEQLEDRVRTTDIRIKARERALEANEHTASQKAEDIAAREAALMVESHTTAEDFLCAICQESAPKVALIPCGHLCLCGVCSQEYEEGGSQSRHGRRTCPICRVPINSVQKIYGLPTLPSAP